MHIYPLQCHCLPETRQYKVSFSWHSVRKGGISPETLCGFLGKWWCHHHQTHGLSYLITECWGNFITQGFSGVVDGRVWSPRHLGAPAAQGRDTWAICAATWPSKCLHWKCDYEGALHSKRYPKFQRNTDLSEHLSSAAPGNPAVLMLPPARPCARHSVAYMCTAQSIMGGGKNEG